MIISTFKDYYIIQLPNKTKKPTPVDNPLGDIDGSSTAINVAVNGSS